MPNDIGTQSTEYLIDNLGQSTSDFTVAEIRAELIARKVLNTDPNESMRGGVYPSRPHA